MRKAWALGLSLAWLLGGVMAGAQTAPAAPSEQQSIEAVNKLLQDPNTLPSVLDAAVDRFRQQFPKSTQTVPILVKTVHFHNVRQEFLPELRYGEAVLRLAPNNLYTLSALGQAIPQNVNSSDLNMDQLLDEAEACDQHVLDVVTKFQITAQGLDYSGQHYTEEQARRLQQILAGPAYLSLGRIAALRGKPEVAAATYRKALPYIPDAGTEAQVYYDIGSAEAAAHQTDAAKAALDKAAALAPNSQLLQQMVQKARAKLSN